MIDTGRTHIGSYKVGLWHGYALLFHIPFVNIARLENVAIDNNILL